MRNKRIVADADDELMEEVLPVALAVFCRGVQTCESRRLVLGAAAAIVLSPFTWPVTFLQRSIHLLIFLVTFWIVRDDLVALQIPDTLVVTVGVVAIFYREIHDEVADLLANMAVIVSAGKLLRWVCNGYLSDAVLRQKLMNSKTMGRLVAPLATILPSEYRREYEELLNLYCESNDPDKERELKERIAGYWKDSNEGQAESL